jgi:hypothetical protein
VWLSKPFASLAASGPSTTIIGGGKLADLRPSGRPGAGNGGFKAACARLLGTTLVMSVSALHLPSRACIEPLLLPWSLPQMLPALSLPLKEGRGARAPAAVPRQIWFESVGRQLGPGSLRL